MEDGRMASKLLLTFARTHSHTVLDRTRVIRLRQALLPCGAIVLPPRTILGSSHPYHSKYRWAAAQAPPALVIAHRLHSPARSQTRVDTSLRSVSNSNSRCPHHNMLHRRLKDPPRVLVDTHHRAFLRTGHHRNRNWERRDNRDNKVAVVGRRAVDQVYLHLGLERRILNKHSKIACARPRLLAHLNHRHARLLGKVRRRSRRWDSRAPSLRIRTA